MNPPIENKLFNTANTEDNMGAEAWNTWYTYSMKNDVYTLKPAVNQGHQANNSGDAEINSANSVLRDGGYVSGYAAAFGNSESIYITVDTDTVNTVKAIDEVTSVTTGVKAVDLKVPAYNKKDATGGVYFVWDSKDYVIAAIVVGDDNAQTKDYIYLLDTKADWERKDGDDYYWQFPAIVEGADSDVIELDVNGWSVLASMNIGLVQVSYNADGYVVKAVDVSTLKAPTYVTDLDDIVRGDTDVVELINVDDGKSPAGPATLYGINDTLYVNNIRSGNGLVMADDASFIVIDDGDVDDTFSNLKSALSAADNNLDKDEVQFDGDISAILNERGEAEVLILSTKTPSSNPNKPVITTKNDWDVEVNTLTKRVDADCELAVAGDYPDASEVMQVVAEALDQRGLMVTDWGNENVTFGSGNRTITVVDPDLNIMIPQTYTVKVNWV